MSRRRLTKIAVVGGSGDLGLGLAVRLAKAYEVMIGSRDADKASAAAVKASTMARVHIEGRANEEATRACDIAILAVPDLPSAELFATLAPNLSNKLVISPIVPMVLKDGIFSVSPSAESAAERVAAAIPMARVASAFQSVPAPMLTRLDAELEYDVLVAAETREIFEEAAPVVSSVGRLRPLYAGPLSVSRMIEAITPTILNVSKLNKMKSPSLRLV